MAQEKFGYIDVRKLNKVVELSKRYVEIVTEQDKIITELNESIDIVLPELERISKLDEVRDNGD